MTQRGNPLALLLLLMGTLWLILLASGLLPHFIDRVSMYLPTWVGGVILILLPIFGGLSVLDVPLGWKVRFVFYFFLILCCSLLPIAWTRYPVLGTIVLASLYVEVFWLIPKINNKLRTSR